MDILSRIVESKIKEVIELKETFSHLKPSKKTPVFIDAINQSCFFPIIAEIKRGSPSKGLFAKALNIESQIKIYEEGGATCISVLTDREFFYGGFEDLMKVRSLTHLPLLCKDFIIDPIQINVAAHFGADCILLIKKILPRPLFIKLYKHARDLGLDVLVEVENENEFNSIKDLPFKLCGVNNRNLRDFTVDFKKTIHLSSIINTTGKILISESGIYSKDNLLELRSHGLKGALIGEALIKSPKNLLEFKILKDRMEIKVCGVKDLDTALKIDKLKIDYLGIVLCDSKRRCDIEVAKDICSALRQTISVGVFMNQENQYIEDTYKYLNLDFVQLHGHVDIKTLNIPLDKIIQSIPYTSKEIISTSKVIIDHITPGQGIPFKLKEFNFTDSKEYYLAGGLSIENIRERTQSGNFRGIDLSSSLESNGIKDIEKINNLITYIGGL